jgi:hypothetical protein
VVRVRDDLHGVHADGLDHGSSVGELVDHEVLVPVERLKVELYALLFGPGTELAERVDQEGGAFLIASRRHERGQALGEQAVGVRGHRSTTAELAHDAELARQLRDRILAEVFVEVADEVRHFDAHGRHDDTVLRGTAELGKPALESEVAGRAQLDAPVAPRECGVELLLERVARKVLFPER